MFTKKALSVAASLALAEQALGFNAHRHHHEDKRAIHYDIVTNWVTVTVTEGDTTPSSTPIPTAQPESVAEVQYSPKPATTTSTTIVVVPTPTPTPVAPAPVPTTTLVTSYAPKVEQAAAPVSSQAPAVQAAAVEVASSSASSYKATSSIGKRGIAYNDASLVTSYLAGTDSESCAWAYDWDSSSNGLAQSNLNFVPMLWGPIDIHTSRWNKNADEAIANGSTHILSFNECDNKSQCNLDAQNAAIQHVKWLNPYTSKNVKIGSPAITNSNIAGEGLDWLKAFVEACKTEGCHFDFCATHWYSPTDAADTLFDHLKSVHEICGGKPVWLTEFAPLGSDDEINSFVQTNLPKLDAVEYLERYSYFMVKDGILVSGNSPTALGKTYASA